MDHVVEWVLHNRLLSLLITLVVIDVVTGHAGVVEMTSQETTAHLASLPGPPGPPSPTRDERIISAADVRKERLAAKKAAILASGLPTATKTAMADLLDGMSDIVDGLVEAIQGGKP